MTERVGDIDSIGERLRQLVQQRGQLTASIDAEGTLALATDRAEQGQLKSELRAYRRGITAMKDRGTFHMKLVDRYVQSVFRAEATDEYGEASELYLELLERAPTIESDTEEALYARHATQLAFLLPDNFLAEEEPRPSDGPSIAGWWRREDPEPATVENARLIEHLKRVAEAEERFANRRFTAGFDDRGKLFVRFGEPTRIERLQSLSLERSVRSEASFIPNNTYWIYDDLEHEAQYLFVEVRGGFRIADTRDLLPAGIRNSVRMPYFGLVAMRDFYQQLSRYHTTYAPLASDVEEEYRELLMELVRRGEAEDEGEASILLQSQLVLDWQESDPTQRHERNIPSLLNQILQTDRQVARRREEAVPRFNTETQPDAMPLPVETHVARFLDDDGTTRTEVYWAPKPGGLDVAAEHPELANYAARDFVLEAALVQYGPAYSRRDISREAVVVERKDTGPNATIPVQSLVVPAQDELHHLALQLDQRLASGEGGVGPAVKQVTVRIDSLSALSSDRRALEMSDLRPMILPDLEAEVELAQMAPDEMRGLTYPFRKLPAGAPLALYFEVYHLAFGVDERTHYTVEYEIHRRTEQGWLRTLFQGRDEQQTVTAMERKGTGSRAEELIVIDLSELQDQQDGQQLRLTVRVTDELTSRSHERTLEFETLVSEE